MYSLAVDSFFIALRLEMRFYPEEIKYDESDFIGSGEFTDVYKAVIEREGQRTTVALKKPALGSRFTDDEMHVLRKETSILLSIPPHENIIKLIGFCDHPRQYALILEYMDDGTLQELLYYSVSYDIYLDDWSNRLDMALQIACGMEHLHSLNPPIIHRNLNPQNIMVRKFSPKYVCKISDFGLSKIKYTSSSHSTRPSENSSCNPVGTVAYISPERYGPQKMDISLSVSAMSDVYSFGVILWQFRELKIPFQDEMELVVADNVQNGTAFDVPKCWCPNGYEKLTNLCCSFNPSDRPTFTDFLRTLNGVITDHGEESHLQRRFQPKDLNYCDSDFLGCGGFAEVYQPILIQNHKEMKVAVKKLAVESSFSNEKLDELKKEMSILLSIPPHKNIIKCLGFCDSSYDFSLVLEFVEGGDLHDLLCDNEGCDVYLNDWKNRLGLAHQVADGMRHLHSLTPPVIHLDLKPQNILVQKLLPSYVCKITDFGLSKICRITSSVGDRGMIEPAGTVAYISPERYGSQDIGLSPFIRLMADVYSFGVILWQFRERKVPFSGENDLVIASNVQKGVAFEVPICWCPDGYQELTSDCCFQSPTERPAFSGVCFVVFSSDHQWTYLIREPQVWSLAFPTRCMDQQCI
jgi:serine/threonine protein kinase